jgi:hypothetical protein
MPHVLIRDIETVPDLVGFAAANGHESKSEDEIRAVLGDKFPKHIRSPFDLLVLRHRAIFCWTVHRRRNRPL